jgi:UDP-GlcNAc:undecaprenyl-phosphate GlcNAc-1-phosphate transferase
MTIPLLALGLPVFETIFSPVRRFLLAKSPFKPDRDHLHHRLLAKGFTTRKAVLVLYGITLCLCIAAIVLVNLEDEQMGLFLVLAGAMAVVFASGIGYFGYMDRDKVHSWLSDLSFVTGMAKDRRRFLNLQVAIGESKSLAQLWGNISRALEELDMDFAEVNLLGSQAEGKKKRDVRGVKGASRENMLFFRKVWSRNGGVTEEELCKRNLFKLELPIHYNGSHLGEMWIVKDLNRAPINHYTLTRIEHMRRSVSNCLKKMDMKAPQESGEVVVEHLDPDSRKTVQ